MHLRGARITTKYRDGKGQSTCNCYDSYLQDWVFRRQWQYCLSRKLCVLYRVARNRHFELIGIEYCKSTNLGCVWHYWLKIDFYHYLILHITLRNLSSTAGQFNIHSWIRESIILFIGITYLLLLVEKFYFNAHAIFFFFLFSPYSFQII